MRGGSPSQFVIVKGGKLILEAPAPGEDEGGDACGTRWIRRTSDTLAGVVPTVEIGAVILRLLEDHEDRVGGAGLDPPDSGPRRPMA